MFCKKCEKTYPESLRFCVECGERLSENKDENSMPKCNACGTVNNPGLKYCVLCGNPFIKAGGYEYHPAAMTPPQYNNMPFQQNTVYAPVKKRKVGKSFAIIAVILIVCFCAYIFRADIIGVLGKFQPGGSENNSSGTDSMIPVNVNIVDSPKSGTSEINLEPIEGFKIHAPEDALDKERTFTVDTLSDEEMDQLYNETGEGVIPIKAFHFDAGLDNSQSFPGNVEISFDLKKLGIDEALWDSIGIARVNQEENNIVRSAVNDGVLKCQVKKNSILLIGLLVTLAGVGTYAVTQTDNGLFGKYLRGEAAYKNMTFQHMYYPYGSIDEMKAESGMSGISNEISGGKYYRLVWPETLQAANPAEVKKAASDYDGLLEKYGLGENGMITDPNSKISLREKKLMQYIKLKKDEAYAKLMGTYFKNEQWIKENLWPAEVRATAEALEIADKYMFQTRKFSRPWTVTDILILNPKSKDTSAVTLAEATDKAFTAPYIMVNAENPAIPASLREYESKKFGVEEMALTLIHEMVHVLQNSTGLPEVVSNDYLWLHEAEAVLVEYEASKYLRSSQKLNGDYTTERTFWHTMAGSLDIPVNSGSIDQNRGYTASQFLEFLRDKYYTNNPDDFAVNLRKDLTNYLPQVINSGITGNDYRTTSTLAAVVRKTSNSWRELADQYTEFCSLHAPEMLSDFIRTKEPKDKNKGDFDKVYKIANEKYEIKLSPDNPLFTFEANPGQQLSSNFTEIKIDKLGKEDKDKSVIALLKPSYKGEGEDLIKVYWTGDKKTFTGYDNEKPSLVPIPEGNQIFLQQIHDYSNSSTIQRDSKAQDYKTGNEDVASKSKKSDILLLTPMEAPELELNDLKTVLSVKWKDNSKLKDLKKEDGKPYLIGYRLTIQPPGKTDPVNLIFDKKVFETEIPLTDITIVSDDVKIDRSMLPEEYKGMTDEELKTTNKLLRESWGNIQDITSHLNQKSGNTIIDSSGGDSDENSLKVSIQYIIDSEPNILGPESDVSEIDLPEKEEKEIGSMNGTWKGKATLTNLSVTLEIRDGEKVKTNEGEKNADIMVDLNMSGAGGETMKYAGFLEKGTGNYKLLMYYSEVKMYVDAMNTSLEPMKDGKLYLNYTQSVLSKVK